MPFKPRHQAPAGMGDRLPRIKIGRALLWLHHATAHEISDARVMSRRSKVTVLCGARSALRWQSGWRGDTARAHEREWMRERAQMAGHRLRGRATARRSGQKQESGIRNRESEGVAKMGWPSGESPLRSRNRNRATESDNVRIGRAESDRVGRNGSLSEESCPEAE